MIIKFLSLLFCAILLNFVICEDTDVEYQCPENIVTIDDEKPIGNLEKYCKDQPCIPKCCKLHEILIQNNTEDIPKCDDHKHHAIKIDYDSKTLIYNTGGKQEVQSNMTYKDFRLVQNKLSVGYCGISLPQIKFHISEDGYVTYNLPISLKIDPLHYCTDLLYNKEENDTKTFIIMSKEKGNWDDRSTIDLYGGISSLISAVFLVLVFVVYCLLPQLRTMPGLLQMTYVGVLFLSFIMRAVIHFGSGDQTYCLVVSSLFYFGFLCSFFWLNIISFDIWWTFRAQRYQRAVHRRGILVKFGWYSLIGWGIPLLMTIGCIIVDIKLPLTTIKPSFNNCLAGEGMYYYLIIPIGILTVTNIILFLMTIHNIWLINREIANMGSNTKNNNRVLIFVKLSLMMGISWILELLVHSFKESSIPNWLRIIIIAYNSLLGLVIFIIFICNRHTLRLLCKRLNIECRFTQKFNINPSSQSTTKSTVHNSSYYRNKNAADSDLEMEEINIDIKNQNLP